MKRGINCCRGNKLAQALFESAGIQATRSTHPNNTVVAKGVPSDILKKRNLFQFYKVAEPQYYSLGDSFKKISLRELKKIFFKARQLHAAHDRLLQYIILRVSQTRKQSD